MAANRTVDLDGVGIPREAVADSANILPGHLLEYNDNGVAQGAIAVDVDVHGTAGGPHSKIFAMENSALGGDISGTGTGAYGAGDRVQFRSFPTGSRVNAICGAAGGVTAGQFVSSDGNGRLDVAAIGEDIVGQALEDAADGERMVVEICSGVAD